MGNQQRHIVMDGATGLLTAGWQQGISLAAASGRSNKMGQLAPGGPAGRQSLFKSLNAALTAEIVCAFRRRENRRWYAEYGGTPPVAESGARCGSDLELADRLAERIVQLGGHPEFALDVLAVPSYGDTKLHKPINDRLSSDLVAERMAVALHQELMAQLGTSDLATSRLLYEFLLADEVYVSSLSELWWSCQVAQENRPIEYAPTAEAD
jgi:bacterioferritin